VAGIEGAKKGGLKMYIWKDQLEAKQRNGNKGSAK